MKSLNYSVHSVDYEDLSHIFRRFYIRISTVLCRSWINLWHCQIPFCAIFTTVSTGSRNFSRRRSQRKFSESVPNHFKESRYSSKPQYRPKKYNSYKDEQYSIRYIAGRPANQSLIRNVKKDLSIDRCKQSMCQFDGTHGELTWVLWATILQFNCTPFQRPIDQSLGACMFDMNPGPWGDTNSRPSDSCLLGWLAPLPTTPSCPRLHKYNRRKEKNTY